VIRANLLPRPNRNVRLGGFDIDTEHLRQICGGIAIVLTVVAIGIAIERLRIRHLENTIALEQALVAARAQERAKTKLLALDVARFQAVARASDILQESGTEAAITIARVGNAIPTRVWLDGLASNGDGYAITGASQSVDALSGAILALDRALPMTSASLVSIDNRGGDRDGVRFAARIDGVNGPPFEAAPEP